MADRALTTRQNNQRSGADARVMRERQAAQNDALDRAGLGDTAIAPRLVVQVYDGGSMPTTTPAVFLTNPVLITGAETEGSAPTFTADAETTLPVVVLRGMPSAGDYLTAYAASNRWVSEEGGSGGAGGVVPCSPCAIPASDLTISWTNILSGNGSDTLVYTGGASPIWQTGCSGDGDAVIFRLGCASGSIELRVYYFTSGSCPTGESSYCSNLLSSPRGLTLSSHDCSPFSLTFTCGAACSVLQGAGYTSFTVTS